jgi:hypothetical protein
MVANMIHIKELVYIGQVAVFYVPTAKLDQQCFGKGGKTPRELFQEFLMEHYDAFTLELSNTQGFWRQNKQSKIFFDENARYEVSFDGENSVLDFVGFLSEMCSLLKEEAIYITMGYKSWLVLPKGRVNEV